MFLMIRRPPRSTLSSSSAASDVYKRQGRINFNVYNNLSTADDQRRDIRAVNMVASGENVLLRFTPAANKAYVVRVSEIRIDKPDNVANDQTVTL